MTFPFRATRPVGFADPLPVATDVVVIGAGVAGVMTAWYLARAGQRVVLCEKGRVAGEQSSRNWGWVRQQGRDPAELPLMIEANRIWSGLSAEIGEDLGFRQTGVLYLADTEADEARHHDWMAHARAHGLDTRQIGRVEVLGLLQGAGGGWRAGLWTASDARAEPWIAVPALARAAQRLGVAVVENCAVRNLDMQAGRVAGVITERGRIAADRVVLAGGAWSSLFLRNLGVAIPQLSVRASVAATLPLPEVFAGAAADGSLAFRRRLDGGYTLAPGGFHEFFIGPDAFRAFGAFWPKLREDFRSTRFLPAAPAAYPDAWRTPRRWGDGPSPFEAMRVLDPTPSAAEIGRLQDRFAAAFPALGRPALAATWAGMIDVMPDVVPAIGHVTALPGLTLATGLSGHGFGIGPAIGRVTADLVMGRAPGHDLHRFRLSRFTDGSRITLGPAL